MKTQAKTFVKVVKVARPVFERELIQLEMKCSQTMINSILTLIAGE